MFQYLILLLLFGHSLSNEERQFSLFNVVKFPDDPCTATENREGVCLTKEECDQRSGSKSGTCAQGYGVCCIVSLGCGQSSSTNNTYLVMSTSKPTETYCEYSFLKSKSTICRFKFTFNEFQIHPPEEGTTATTAPTGNGGSIGQCINDAFVISTPGGPGSPMICGYNTNQHIFVDAPSAQAVVAAFTFGTKSYARKYNIKVSQYQCGAEAAGPPGCLQYFTGTSGAVANFNFPTRDSATSTTTTHLANQYYTICFRREAGYCGLCFYSKFTGGSFGLSAPGAAAAKSITSASCTTDFIAIPYGGPSSFASEESLTNLPTPVADNSADRNCGRYLNTDSGQTSEATVCTGIRPFRLRVNFDENEVVGTPATEADDNEQAVAPGGIVGFYLAFAQEKCT